MFYNPAYLRKKERFGLIWLAATQSKRLSRRELVSIDLPTVCEDVIAHIMSERRFSLCLSSHLMFGAVTILNKQWDCLLMDLQILWMKSRFVFTLLSSKNDIDIVPGKERHVLHSNIPSNEGDAKYDRFFGAYKEPIVDIETMLAHLESLSEEREVLSVAPVPNPVVPEIGSPNSVTDPKEIQIRDVEMSPSIVPIPGEKELPRMDSKNMKSFLSTDQEEALKELEEQFGLNTSIQEQAELLNASLVHDRTMSDTAPPENQDPNVIAVTELLMDAMPQTSNLMEGRAHLPLEETPMAKSAGGMPEAPQKPRVNRPKKTRDPNKRDSRFTDLCNEEMRPEGAGASGIEGGRPISVRNEQTSSDDSFLLRQQQQMEKDAEERGHGHDWALKNAPAIELSPLTQVPSPLRRKRSHKLIIDEIKEMTTLDLKENQKKRDDTIIPMELPETLLIRNIYKEPNCKYLRSKALEDLYVQNCQFGLRMDDTGSGIDLLPSPRVNEFLARKRARRAMTEETPVNKLPRRSESEVASIERARAGQSGTLSESLGRKISQSPVQDVSLNLSKSSLRGLISDTSKEGSILDHDGTLGAALPSCPEERELVICPDKIVPEVIPEVLPQDEQKNCEDVQVTIPEVNIQPDIDRNTSQLLEELFVNGSMTESIYSPRTELLKLVEGNMRLKNDWTTFTTICPTTLSRKKAASMFHALLVQVSRRNLCVRQSEPYGTIFVWVKSAVSSGTSASD